ncbi:uncharacterized protein LOC126984268 [Eriocheir sinensis]|uniref:uncharacterized protein LOC126984268 n=1 Tax=Eriocheir sinensis TaxID=95602 RepID=UPI0021CAD4CD|nr:uncharacterized protein LOC126984268 [Eriocheir sinensis]
MEERHHSTLASPALQLRSSRRRLMFAVPYGLRGFSRFQGAQSAQESQQGAGDVFILGNMNENLEFQSSSSNRLSDDTSRPIDFQSTVGDAGQFTGSFPGTTQQSNAAQFSGPFAGSVPQSNLFGAQRPFFQRQTGLESQSGNFQAQFLGDSRPSGRFTTGPVFQSLGSASSGSRKIIEARPDVTLTRTVTLDRFVTTTDVAFVEQPRTATIFSFLTHTAVTTVVLPTPVDRNVVVSTAVVTRAPLTVTVTDVRSEFQYVTRTELRYVTLTHTSYSFTQDTLLTTVTRVQTISTTVTRTDINTVTTTFTENRTVISTVFPSYY